LILWPTLAATLLGVNLVRLQGRGLVVASGLVIVLVSAAAVGWLPVPTWWRFFPAVGLATLVVVAWRPLVMCDEARRSLLGWIVVASCGAGIVALLSAEGSSPHRMWIGAAAILALAEPTTRLLRGLLRRLGTPPPAGPEPGGRGEAIGILERWMVYAVVTRGEYAAMAFIIAAKALARHKRFEDSNFAEYFLVGTLASLLAAVAVAEAVSFLATRG